jgi:hypothetical protein
VCIYKKDAFDFFNIPLKGNGKNSIGRKMPRSVTLDKNT